MVAFRRVRDEGAGAPSVMIMTGPSGSDYRGSTVVIGPSARTVPIPKAGSSRRRGTTAGPLTTPFPCTSSTSTRSRTATTATPRQASRFPLSGRRTARAGLATGRFGAHDVNRALPETHSARHSSRCCRRGSATGSTTATHNRVRPQKGGGSSGGGGSWGSGEGGSSCPGRNARGGTWTVWPHCDRQVHDPSAWESRMSEWPSVLSW